MRGTSFRGAGGFQFGYQLTPWVKRLLIANGAVFLLTFALDNPRFVADWLAFQPNRVLVRPWGVLTYMFVHLGFLHLAGNMAFLWVFGDNVEDAMGYFRFLLFYLLCGVIAGLTHIALEPDSQIPVIGASGAVGGIIGAYLMLHPNVKVWVLALYRIPLRITAAWAIGVWVAVQIYNAFFSEVNGVAWGAHLGGLAAGAVLIVIMRQPGVPLFDKTVSKV